MGSSASKQNSEVVQEGFVTKLECRHLNDLLNDSNTIQGCRDLRRAPGDNKKKEIKVTLDECNKLRDELKKHFDGSMVLAEEHLPHACTDQSWRGPAAGREF